MLGILACFQVFLGEGTLLNLDCQLSIISSQVKDVGGFFVGVSPEWQLAIATTAFFETLSVERATARKWSRDFLSRDVGYVRATRLGDQVLLGSQRRS